MKEVKLKIDDKEFTVPADWTVIKACRENGIEIPHFCYHEDLSIAGNCRICMVGVKGAPRPVVACAQPVAEGMEVTTASQEVLDARKSVMEFMLINHPLDCPECDQSGECKLQDHSYDWGRDHGRFEEEKVRKSKATFGPHVKYWGSRCIVCTRCVRFSQEVSGGGELGVIYRGDRSEIALFPGQTLDNPLSMNNVDVCPVGALVSSDFLFQARAWHLRHQPSLCAECSVGCNTEVHVDAKDHIQRIIPRRNEAVNKSWMCDHGRLAFPYQRTDRLQAPTVDGLPVSWKAAREAALETLARPGAVALVSAWNTNEAYAALKDFLDTAFPSMPLHAFAAPGGEDQVFPGFTIAGDKIPNRAGLAQVLGIADAEASLQKLAAGKEPIPALLLLCNIPDFEPGPELKAVLDRAQTVVLLDFAAGALLRYGNVGVALPTLTHFEKSGTFVNKDGLAQAFAPAVEPATFGKPEAELFAEWAKAAATNPTRAVKA